ncbi:MAG: hypothetical protein IKZ56_04075 [Bacteroidales bacterium]|nr:hypothetical protein [Bacteroidales bacterium]
MTQNKYGNKYLIIWQNDTSASSPNFSASVMNSEVIILARLNDGDKVPVRRENDMGFQGEIDKERFFEQLLDKFYAFLEENLHGMSSRVVDFARNAAYNTLTNLVYNLCRYEQVMRLGMNQTR